MSLLVRAGISRLSELEIDADKDWEGKGIFNLKEIALGMGIGDIIQHNGVKLVKLSAGTAHHVLTSAGPGKLVVWAPGGMYLHRFFPVAIYSAHSEAKVFPDRSYNESITSSTWRRQSYLDAPADFIKRLNLPIALIPTGVTVFPNRSSDKLVPVATALNLLKVVDGAVADDGGAQTDETVAAQNTAPDDMMLLPVAPVVGDAYYFGGSRLWDSLRLNMGRVGVGTWIFSWEYWNGTTWTALADVVDNTSAFHAGGTNNVDFTRPGDWALTTILTMNLYWVRARVSSFTDIITQPLGTQAWCEFVI